MKVYIKIIFLLILFVSCHSKTEDSESSVLKEEKLNEMLELKKQIIELGLNPKKNNSKIVAGRELYSLAINYIKNNQEDPMLERVYEIAAFGAENAENYDEAINNLYQAQQNFPDSKQAPIYLFNRARIIEVILKKQIESKLAYEELIDLYPNDSLAIEMKSYIESPLFGKSDKEILDFLNSKN